jgi:hypothetical protein
MLGGEEVEGVGVMKDEELKLEEIEAYQINGPQR